jgi:hypothetical protein
VDTGIRRHDGIDGFRRVSGQSVAVREPGGIKVFCFFLSKKKGVLSYF